MVFDDFKYQQKPMGRLMELCEAGISRDMIVGGKTQAEIAEEIRMRAEMDEYRDVEDENAEFSEEDEASASTQDDLEGDPR